jgi:hypothetical protein
MSKYQAIAGGDPLQEDNTPGKTPRKFLIFSMPRCGSTTLQRLVNCHPRIQCLEEPFNPFNYDGKYLRQVFDMASLDDTLLDIWRTNNGIKHTWCPDGWPFIGNQTFNAALLLKPGQKIVYLRRRNLFRRLVSVHVSNQTGIWGLFSQNDRPRVANCVFTSMDMDATKSQLDWDNRMLGYYQRLLVDSGSDFMELAYEDLYDPAATTERRLIVLNEIFAFLGADPIGEENAMLRVKELLDPTIMKFNSIETYRRIPGIADLEKECGSDEMGWLLQH